MVSNENKGFLSMCTLTALVSLAEIWHVSALWRKVPARASRYGRYSAEAGGTLAKAWSSVCNRSAAPTQGSLQGWYSLPGCSSLKQATACRLHWMPRLRIWHSVVDCDVRNAGEG